MRKKVFGPLRVWHWLTEPPASIERPELRRHTHLLLSILASLSLVWGMAVASILLRIGLGGTKSAGADLSTTSVIMYLCGGVVMISAFLIARRGHAATASRLFVGVALALSFLYIVYTRDIRVLDFPINAIVLCSLLLTPADMGVTYALTLFFYLLLPFLIRSVTLAQMINVLVVTFFIGAVSVASTLFHERNLKQLENQALEMAKDAKRLEETKRMESVARMAAGAAHEFNNTLMSISAYAQAMERSATGVAVDDAKAILEASRQGSRLTDKVLSLSQQQLLKPKAVNVEDMLRSRERDLGSFLRPGTRLILRSSPRPIVLQIDADHFFEALRTLVRKAEGNLGEHGNITIWWKAVDLPRNDDRYLPAGAYCAFTISNSGPRTNVAVDNRIFDPFSETPETGIDVLDIAAALGIVRQIGGQIETRTDPELGTVFVVTVPMWTPAP